MTSLFRSLLHRWPRRLLIFAPRAPKRKGFTAAAARRDRNHHQGILIKHPEMIEE